MVKNYKELLKNSFGIIRQFVREIFGIDTQIKSQGCTKVAEVEVSPEIHIPVEEPTVDETPIPEPVSMVEDVEIGVGSCVSQCDESSITREFAQ